MSMEVGEAIVVALRTDSTLTDMLASGAAGIALGLLPAGTATPYIAVFDLAGVPSYTLGNNEAYSAEAYDVYVYAEDDDDESAQSVAGRVLRQIKEVLHNQEIPATGRRIENIRQGRSLPSRWETISSSERYFKAGRQYDLMTCPA